MAVFENPLKTSYLKDRPFRSQMSSKSALIPQIRYYSGRFRKPPKNLLPQEPAISETNEFQVSTYSQNPLL